MYAHQDRVIVVGSGVAGLATALHLAPLPVLLIAAGSLGLETSTWLAQGGISAALDQDDDPRLHALDTVRAGVGLVNEKVARRVTEAAADCIRGLQSRNISLDVDPRTGRLALGLEAAHSRRRVVHIAGDATGRELVRNLIREVRKTPSIKIMEQLRVARLVRDDRGGICGVECDEESGRHRVTHRLLGRAVILSTGGACGLYAHTTNPLTSVGSGLVLAGNAGATLRDLEFVQFHPTAIDVGLDPMPLATETLRGEGAILVNDQLERFMDDIPGRELASRDVVALAIFAEVSAGRRVFLDTRKNIGESIVRQFPTVTTLCRNAGVDPVREPIPVRPAAHYHMGGIQVDERGRSTVAGLWACGEVASTGLHGANRLASNSLLEALVYARWIAEDVLATTTTAGKPGSAPSRQTQKQLQQDLRPQLRSLMDRDVGVFRDRAGLMRAKAWLATALGSGLLHAGTLDHDALAAAALIADSALRREESRGAHQRIDRPQTSPQRQHTIIEGLRGGTDPASVSVPPDHA